MVGSSKPLFIIATFACILVVLLFVLNRRFVPDTSSLPLTRLETEEGTKQTNSDQNPVVVAGNQGPPPSSGTAGERTDSKRDSSGQPFYSLLRRPTQTSSRIQIEKLPPNSHIQIVKPSPTALGTGMDDEEQHILAEERLVAEEQERLRATTAPPLPTFSPSKDLFVRAVYFDGRPRDEHRNTSVFLVVCLKEITDNNLIVGCMVDGKRASKFSVNLIGETPLWRAFYPHINHEEVLVHCYDLPARNGSTAHILYTKNGDGKGEDNSDVILAASERPYFIPAPRITPTSTDGRRYNMTIVACAKIFGHPPWLKEWLTYQRTLGVDHVHLDAEDSFIGTGMMNEQYFRDLKDQGFVSVDIWKKYLSPNEIWYHNQGLIYEDCPYRFRGTYDYIVMMDTDDFFTPRIPTEKKIHYYIQNYCRGSNIGSCKFRWVEYYPDYVKLNNESMSDGNVTRRLNNYVHYNQGNPKSLHRTTVLIDTATHYAYKMMPGYKIFKVSASIAYVAHVRLYKKKPERGYVEGLPNACCSEHVLSKVILVTALTVFMLLLCGLAS